MVKRINKMKAWCSAALSLIQSRCHTGLSCLSAVKIFAVFSLSTFSLFLSASALAALPVIGGTAGSQPVDDIATVAPFSVVTITDTDGHNVSVTVTLDAAAKGVFTSASLTASGFVSGGSGIYTLAADLPANAEAAIRQLVFDPADNRVAAGLTETTTFTIVVDDGTLNASDANTSVVATSVNDAPAIGGAATGQTIDEIATISPFSGITITDADVGDVTTTVTLDINAKGVFTAASLSASGFTGSGPYTLAAATPASAESAIRQLVFDPTDNRVNTGLAETTTFTIGVNDGVVTTNDANTTVISTAVNEAPVGIPTISGVVTENQTLSADTSGISDAEGLGTFSYQWLRDNVDIAGATASTYTLSQADVGSLISVRVNYTDGGGTAESVISAQTTAVGDVNNAPSGAPVINGSATQGVTLTTDITGISDADGLGAFSYQWQRGGTDISGATADSYLLGQVDVGSTLTVTISYIDGGGTTESITSAATAVVADVNDPPVGLPTISGSATQGQLLTAVTTGISDADGLGIFSYQWLRGGLAITGASNDTYTLVQADVGNLISVRVSYTDGAGNAESVTSAQTTAVGDVNDPPVGVPTISGVVTENQTLSVSTSGISDADGLGTFSYQWLRDNVDIAGAATSTYTLSQVDVGGLISVRVSYTDGGGTAESVTSAQTTVVVNVNDPPVGVPFIAGIATEKEVLTADTSGISDADGLGTFSYQWLRDNVSISGALGNTYTLIQGDVGSRISVRVSYLDGGNTAENVSSAQTAVVVNANDLPLGVPVINGSATQGVTLTTDITGISDADGLGVFSYQWQRGGSDIAGATADTYLLGQIDVGSIMTVTVSYVDGGGTTESITSAATTAVANVNDLPVGVPTITGVATENQSLTADTSGISDIDGLGTFSYQWLRDNVGIAGATGSSYTLSQADVGSLISVRVSYTDGGSTLESLTSTQTTAVINVNNPPAGVPLLSGVTEQGSLLTVDTSGISDLDGLGSFSYQWQRSGVDINGATAGTFLLSQADVGSTIKVVVSYLDGGGTNETVSSAATAVISDVNDPPTGSPAISGTAAQGQTLLVVTSSISDADGLGPFNYQWQRGGVDIAGATAGSYLLQQADVGSTIKVVVSYVDGGGTTESLPSAATAVVADVNDPPVGLPTINGVTTQGQTLTAVTSGISDADGLGTFNYQWSRGGLDIVGATSNSYLLQQVDVGSTLTVTVSYLDAGGTTESLISAATVAIANINDVPVGVPIINGSATQGATLTADTTGISDADGLGTFSYQWQRGSTDIAGATASTYLLDQADVGSTLTVTVSYLDGGGNNETLTSAATAVVNNTNDLPTGVPVINGSATQGVQLTSDTSGIADKDGLGVFSYQWLRGGAVISGANATTYTLQQADVGAQISLRVSYTDLGGTAETVTSVPTAAVANINDLPTGNPVISGVAAQGSTLIVDTTAISDPDGLGVFSYQWRRTGVDIAAATASSYILQQADVGNTITVVVSYVDAGNTTETLTSTATAVVTDVNDAPVGTPSISGLATQGQLLTAQTSGISDSDGLGVFSYQWSRNNIDVSGATASSYLLDQADVGSTITVTVSYVDGGGTTETLVSAATPAVANVNDAPSGLPVINGIAAENETLVVNTLSISDADGLGAFSYQWSRNGADIGSATASSYTLVQADVGSTITVTVSYLDGGNTAESVTSAATAVIANANDAPTGSPTISGTLTQGQVLTVNTTSIGDVDGLGSFSYQWRRSGANISGATGTNYTLVQADVGKAISVRVSYVDGGGTTENLTSAATTAIVNINDIPVGLPTITGTATENQQLTAVTAAITDADGLGAFSYQWLRDGAVIAGATASTYILAQADVGAFISVRVSYTDGGGTAESLTSAQTAVIINVNNPPSGVPVISGTTTQNAILSADTSSISDVDGLGVFSYRWLRDGAAISGATASNYVLAQNDVGTRIQVRVSYTDGGGAAESVTSAQTAIIANVNDLPSGLPIISGAITQGSTLTADTSAIFDADGLGAFSYRWLRDGVDIGGATDIIYTLVQADVGSLISVRVSYTDGGSTSESVTSLQTVVVTNINDAPTGVPVITGNATQGVQLTADTSGISDADGLGAFSYQWLRSGVAIPGATASTYQLQQADVGSIIRVTVNYIDGGGQNESLTSAATTAVIDVNDPPVGVPVINGSATQGVTLSADVSGISDADGLGSFSYQWRRSGTNIIGATASTYLLQQADVTHTITVRVRYIDAAGTTETVFSAATGAVTDVNDPPLGSPGINGAAVQGQSLTAVTSAISDSDGLNPFSYQWRRDGVIIPGATTASYLLTQADVGSTLTVTVSYVDGGGTTESIASAATAVVTNVNDLPVGLPTISGVIAEDQLLTVDTSAISDVDGLGAFSYQWLRDGAVIGGATAISYTLVQADVGARISVRVSYTDGGNTVETVTSAQTAAVTNVNDNPVGTLVISGSAIQGAVLTADTSAISDADGLGGFVYQWSRNGTNITGATASTYTLTQVDVGSRLRVTASYVDGGGTTETLISAQTTTIVDVNDEPLGVPVINGTPIQGSVLSADPSGISDADGLGVFSFQWLRGGQNIPAATAATYQLEQADVGAFISVQVIYTDGGNTVETITSAQTASVANINDVPTGVPIVNGSVIQGNLLSVDTSAIADADGLGVFSYQWLRSGIAISGETADTYTLVQADVSAFISVVISYVDGDNTAESITSPQTAAVANANDAPVGVPVINGSPVQNAILSVDASPVSDIDGLGVFSYQWLRDGAVITGANAITYQLVQADVGKAITVRVAYVDGGGANEAVISAQTAVITNVNDTPLGLPVISGVLAQNAQLTVDTSAISDLDGLGGFSFQWKRAGVDIVGATATTYTLTQDDVGRVITVTASYTDGGNTPETVISSPTAVIANVNDIPVGNPSISGSVTQGVILTTDTSTITDIDGVGVFQYQWLRDGTPIAAATGKSYQLKQADVGSFISVRVSYVDGGGTTETLISAQTTRVTNTNDAPVGVPTITGIATERQVLSASTIAISDADGLGAFSYQWLRNAGVITGATAINYTLVQADVGTRISVRVTYTDGGNTAESVTSAQTAIVANVNDAPVGVPVINGSLIQGSLITADVTAITDIDGLGVFSYRWMRDAVAITGATASNYQLVQADVGAQMSVQVSYIDGGNTLETVLSAPSLAVGNVNDAPVGLPVISGSPTQGVLLTAVTSGISDADGLGVFSYQWNRDGAAISGAIAETYMLEQADVGTAISVTVSYTDADNTAESVTSVPTTPVANVNDLPVGVPLIAGSVTQGGQLQADTSGITDLDGLGVTGFSYQWLRNGVDIVAATSSSYTLVQDDVASVISVRVSYVDGDNVAESVTSAETVAVTNVNDAPVGSPLILGVTTQGEVLSVDVSGISDIDGLGIFSYQWLRDGSAILDATESNYVLQQDDVDAFISVQVSYTDGGGTDESILSGTVGPVGNINDPGTVTIIGQATEASVLTVGEIFDADGTAGINPVYQWLRDGIAIPGETGNSYLITSVDLTQFISLRVSYTDDRGADEIVLSNIKGPIFPDVPSVTPPAAVGPVNATGWFTRVDLNPGEAFATDALDGKLTPVPQSSGFFRPGETVVTWTATDSAGNVGTAEQIVRVIPLVEISAMQQAAEGSSGVIKVALNGDALTYPVIVPYTVSDSIAGIGSGTADSNDHDLVDGIVTITQPPAGELPEAVIPFSIVDDGVSEGVETLVVSLGDASSNAVPGLNSEHTIEILEGNVAPVVTMEATQLQLDDGSGSVSVFAMASDANDSDTLNYDWQSESDNALFSIGTVSAGGAIFSFDPNGLAPGFYTLSVIVDDGSESASSNLIFNIVIVLPELSAQSDSDNDGIDDLSEGFTDSDGDGIADYLDAITASNIIQTISGTSDAFVMQSDPGLKLSLGEIAVKADHGASMVEEEDVTTFGAVEADTIANVGGYFDFTITDLAFAGDSVRIVIPQHAPMPKIPIYRKLTPSGWKDFVSDSKNSIASAPGSKGYCPPPGDPAYRSGLGEGRWCLQLTIEDGGPNDGDGKVNSRVSDPGGIGRFLTDVSVSSSGGGGSWHPLVPALSILIMLGLRRGNTTCIKCKMD